MDNTNQSSNKFFAYIRVSTKDQERGASLDEQRRQIYSYAKDKELEITKEFREVQSASKMGRIQFEKMVKELNRSKDIRGCIFWSVDRSARNPFDQSRLFLLKEYGFELHFAADRIDSTNHSAMSMIFIRWGIASSFSEDLKMRTKMGIMGRLKEGKCPGRAPFGYLDRKLGEYRDIGIKVIDPIRGPLLKKAFELYSKGDYTIPQINKIMTSKGLRNAGSNPLHWKMLYKVFRNSFYYGHIYHNGQLYKGIHKPLISKILFDRVQMIIEGKANNGKQKHFYQFQGLVKCKACNKIMRSVTAKKKYQYFYCRRQDCYYENCVQHQSIENTFLNKLDRISFYDDEVESFKQELRQMRSNLKETKEEQKKHIENEIMKFDNRLSKLLDKSLDNDIPDEVYRTKKNQLMSGVATLKERRVALEDSDDQTVKYLEELGKLLKRPVLLYKSLKPEQKRKFLKSMVENFSWDGSNVGLIWKKPFNLIAERPIPDDGSLDGI